MKPIITSILIAVMFLGCATRQPLTSMPKSPDEYRLSKEVLSQKYPEIPEYEDRWRGFVPNFPSGESLVKEMGEPDKIKRHWWYPIVGVGVLAAMSAELWMWIVVLAIRPDIPKTYIYQKEEHCIEVMVDRTVMNGYKEYMTSWKWNDQKEKCLD